jgi:sec-independent protein translocase protein TatA
MNTLSLVESTSTLALFFGGPGELVVIAGIALLLFGKRLPGAAKSLGMSFSAFKKGIKDGEEDLDDSSASPTDESQSPPE